jgi:hypothetical protein
MNTTSRRLSLSSMSSSRPRPARLLLCAGLCASVGAGVASAQPAGPGGINFWINPTDGSWYDSLAWGGVLPSQGGVPDSTTTASITGNTAYRIDVPSGTAQCHHLFINNPLATLRVAGAGAGNSTFLVINGTQWDSTGTVQIGGPGSASANAVRINNNITIGGSGTLRLDAQGTAGGAALASQFNQGFLLINGAPHTISGEGNISVRLQNEGTVRADVPARPLVLDSSFLTTNNGTISATGGAVVQLNNSGGVLQGAGGRFSVGPGSELQVFSLGTAGLTGGSISTGGTGRVLIATQGAKFNEVTLTAGSLLTFLGNSGVFFGPLGVRNFGTINTGPSGFVTSDFGGSSTISGTGRLQMEGGTLGSLFGGGGYALTNAADHTIGGHGTINLALTNFGTVLADRNGQTTSPTDLLLQQSAKSNSGSIIARSGGVVRLQQNVTLTQTTFGTLSAEDASAVVIQAATVTGGRLSTSGTGSVVIIGAQNTLDDVRLTAGSRAVITCSGTAQAQGSINIDGTLEIRNDGCGPNFATLQVAHGGALNGGGTVRLLPTAGSSNVNIVSQGTSAMPIGLGLGLTIAGQGNLNGPINSQATLAPDRAHLPAGQGGGVIGQLLVNPGAGNFRLRNGGRYECDIAGPGARDTIIASGPVELGGELSLQFIAPYVPSVGDIFDVLTASSLSGAFASVSAGGLPPDRRASVSVLPDRVRVTIRNVCTQSDVAGPGQTIGADGDLTADDIIVFVNWFFAADARADVAGQGQTVGADGQFTADDIILFVNRFFAGC